MFRTRGLKILRDILARKGRTFLVSFAIFIGVAGTIALCSMSFIVTGQLNEDIQTDQLPMLEVFLAPDKELTYDDATYLSNLEAEFPSITQTMAIAANVSQFKPKEDADEFEDAFVYSFNYPYGELPMLEIRLLEGGAYPEANQHEVLIEKRLADKYELGVGDTIYLRILSPSLTQTKAGDQFELGVLPKGIVGTVEPYTISGIVFHAYAGATNATQFQPQNSIYTLPEDNSYITGTVGFNGYEMRFNSFGNAEDLQTEITQFLANETPYKVVFSQATNPEQNQLITGAQTLTGVLSCLAVIALVVCGFLVFNVISSIVTEQKRQIGIMKTLGASQRDNFIMFAGISFGYGLLGVIPGLLVGIPGGNAASHALAPQLNTLLEGFKFSPQAIGVGVCLGLFIPIVAAIIPVYFGTRVKILNAITDIGISNNYGTGPLAKIIERLPVPITIRQGLSNISMKKVRLIMTVITLSIAVGAFVGIFGMLASLEEGFGSFLDTFNVEIGVFPTDITSPEASANVIRNLDNVKSVEYANFTQINFVGYEPEVSAGGPPGIIAYGYDVTSPDPAFRIDVAKGEKLTEETRRDGIIITSELATGMNVDIGDTVTLQLPAGTRDVKVIGWVDFPVTLAWMDWRLMSEVAQFTVGAPTPNQYFTQVNVEGLDTPVNAGGLTPSFVENLTLTDGTTFAEDNHSVVISHSLADAQGYQVGDSINITATTNGATAQAFTVSGIAEAPPQLEGDFIAFFWKDLATLEGKSLTGEPVPTGFFVNTTLKDATKDDVDEVIEDMEAQLLDQGISVQIFNFVELTEQFTEAIVYIQIILQAVVLLIAAIGALGLLTTLSMSVFERQKEIGVMRSIGASSMTVAIQFLTEGIVVGIIAWIIGLPIAIIIQWGLMQAAQLDDAFGFSFSWEGALIALAGTLVITTIASLWPSFAAARRTVSDILRYQ